VDTGYFGMPFQKLSDLLRGDCTVCLIGLQAGRIPSGGIEAFAG
jgi:hypothetical protein